MEGLVVLFDVWRITFQDDAVGGANATGTVIAESIRGQMDVKLPSQQSLEQGLEAPRIADVLLRPQPGTLTILERDLLEIKGPADQPHINTQWRVVGVQEPTGMHPKNRQRFLKLRITRVDRTRTEALQ
jgi:hypothetical protein